MSVDDGAERRTSVHTRNWRVKYQKCNDHRPPVSPWWNLKQCGSVDASPKEHTRHHSCHGKSQTTRSTPWFKHACTWHGDIFKSMEDLSQNPREWLPVGDSGTPRGCPGAVPGKGAPCPPPCARRLRALLHVLLMFQQNIKKIVDGGSASHAGPKCLPPTFRNGDPAL